MTYTVKPGDTLSKIAKLNGCSTAQLMKANPQVSDPNKIKVGDVLTLPNGLSDLTTDNTKPLPQNPPDRSRTTGSGRAGSGPGRYARRIVGEI
jgi:morphogenetic protein associated with SpoVID